MTEPSTHRATPMPLLTVDGITKSFGDLVANDHVDLDILPGEIHALLGENGAGKSTLVKMLFGSLKPDAGRILWNGTPVTITNPSAARQLGIGMVFQHFSLFDALTVAENIALSLDEDVPLVTVVDQARRLGETYGLSLNPHALAGDLSVGERQRVEIIRCLLQKPELIILDEPTSVLTPQEADRLFETLEQLKSEGRAILYISHKLDEVKRLCDRATILRHGEVVSHRDPRQETAASLAALMVGANVAAIERRDGNVDDTATAPAVALEVRGLDQPPLGPFSTPLTDVHLSVHEGEVFGIAGVAGNGQSELFEALSGEQLQASADQVIIAGTPAGKLGPNGRRRLGAAFAPEERFGHAAVANMALTDNILLSRHASDASAYQSAGQLGVVRLAALGRTLARVVEAMDVRKSGDNPNAGTLSGGNLQKLILGREFDRRPAVLIINQPTWGVDAGAAARIRQTLIDAARQGAAALVISQDLDELLEISDRIAVMHNGEISQALDARRVTPEQLGLLMGGAEPEKHHGIAP